MSNKRKSEAISTCGAHNFVPKSISSYLCGALNTDFASTRELIRRENSFIDEGHNEPEEFLDQVIEEVFRYLFLITDCAENHEIQLSPSLCVDKVFHSLLLDPVLYHRICDTILNLRGITSDMRPIRVLPHNPLGGSNTRARDTRYQNTLVQYVSKFNDAPPEHIWPQNLFPTSPHGTNNGSGNHSNGISSILCPTSPSGSTGSSGNGHGNKHVSFRTGGDEVKNKNVDENGEDADDEGEEDETESDNNVYQLDDLETSHVAPFFDPPESEPKMTLNVKTMTGHVFKLKHIGTVSETVLNVMHRINMLEDTPVGQQRIIINGTQANPADLLSAHNVQDGDTVSLLLRHTATFA